MVKILPVGYTTTMTTTATYSLPTGQNLIYVQGSGALELSNDNSTFTAATLTNGGVLTAARFAKTTTGTLIASCQKA
jgi:autotransporter-associated beta strand protein